MIVKRKNFTKGFKSQMETNKQTNKQITNTQSFFPSYKSQVRFFPADSLLT